MAMITRCPACNTHFRVVPVQLQAQNGMVRCGHCSTVFDGFKTLSTVDTGEPAQSTAEGPAPELEPAATARVETAPVEPAPEFQLEPVSATELAATAGAPTRDPVVKEDRGEAAHDFGPVPEQLTIEDHLFLEESREAKARSARWWAAGVVLLLVTLAAQAVYVYRGELAAHFAPSRAWLTRMCELAGCAVLLPQRPKAIAIEASDLQAIDPARPGTIQLTATVRNHAGYGVGFPALDLVLTNSRDHTLARRIFLPRDYLEPGHDVRTGIPAAGELTIRLDLDTSDLDPSGFRLDLLAAPNP